MDWKTTLNTLVAELDAIAPLKSAVAYGSAARGEYREGRSDLNLLLTFEDCTAKTLTAIGPALQGAWRANRVRPYLLEHDEVARVADVFPLKLLEIREAHVLLHGADPLEGLTIDREHLRIRVEQELRNELIRLRWQLVHGHDEPLERRRDIARVVRTLRPMFFGMLHLRDEAPTSLNRSAVFAAASKMGFELDPLTDQDGDLDTKVHAALATLTKAVAILDGMGES